MSELSSLYQEIILDHSRTPHGVGLHEHPDGQAHQVNPVCGDSVTVAVTVRDDALAEITWEGAGCAISQASASLMTGLIEQQPLTTVRELVDEFRTAMRSRGKIELDEERFDDAVALGGASKYVARVKCAMLAWTTLEMALDEAGH